MSANAESVAHNIDENLRMFLHCLHLLVCPPAHSLARRHSRILPVVTAMLVCGVEHQWGLCDVSKWMRITSPKLLCVVQPPLQLHTSSGSALQRHGTARCSFPHLVLLLLSLSSFSSSSCLDISTLALIISAFLSF